MSAQPLPVSFQPALVEEVVLRAVAGRRDERPFRHERNKLYLLPEDDRDRAFAEFHAKWFAQLGFGRPIDAALAELPLLAQACARCVVTRAPTHGDEGADLLVAPEAEGAAARTVLLRLCPDTFTDAEALQARLRAELLHVADMLDPAFGYQPVLPPVDGGPSCERLLRERYRALWEASVAGRLVRRGAAGGDAQAQAFLGFAAAFPMLSEAETGAAFVRFFDGTACTHAQFVAFAAAPRPQGDSPGLAPGGRCPLCRFPTYAPEPNPGLLPPEVVARVIADFPTWRPCHGLCGQCAELYRARPLSAGAAESLPNG
jgi:hypothetical protein